jgi:hypothetical protein
MTNQSLHNLIQKVISLGADKNEMQMWEQVFPTLPADQQESLKNNLMEEIKALEAK